MGAETEWAGPVDMLRWQKESAVKVEKTQSMTEEELRGKFTIGVLVDRDLPFYTQEYSKVREAAKATLAKTG